MCGRDLEVTGLGDEGLATVRGDVVDDTVAEEVEDPLVDGAIAVEGEDDVEGRRRKGLLRVEAPGRGAELLQNLEDRKECVGQVCSNSQICICMGSISYRGHAKNSIVCRYLRALFTTSIQRFKAGFEYCPPDIQFHQRFPKVAHVS